MSGYLYVPNNLRGIKDYIQDYIIKGKTYLTIKSNSFQRKDKLITTPFLLQ